MSWAARNPELYAEIERNAVVQKLTSAMKDNGFDVLEVDGPVIEAIVQTLQNENPSDRNDYWSRLVMWSQKELSDCEADALSQPGRWRKP